MVNIIACYCTCSKLFVQGDHPQCYASSSSQMAGYIRSRALITNPKAQEELLRCIKATYVYKHADAFCPVMIAMLFPEITCSYSVGTRTGWNRSTTSC